MSGAQTSSFYPVNQLLVDNAQQIANQYAPQRNELFIQKTQQEIGAGDTEEAARIAGVLLTNYKTPEERAAIYPSLISQAQAGGRLKNAPTVYPGDERAKAIWGMGVSAEKQYEQQGVASDYQTWLRSRGGGGTGQPAAGTTAAPGAVAPASDIEVPAQQRARAVYDGMIKRGADHATAAAWAANALHESAANPSTGPGDQGASQGLFMWNGPRLQAYQAKYGHGPQGAPLDEQLDFVMHELGGTEAPAAARIAQAGTVTDKAAAISREFLRPKDREGEQQRRSATAQQLNTLWQPPQVAAAPGTGGGVAARTGGTNVAGPPGTVPGAAPAAGVPVPGGQGLVTRQDGTVGTPNAGGLGTGTPPAAVAAPAQPSPAATQAAPVVNIPPPPPRLPNGLTADQDKTIRDLEAIPPRNRADFVERQKLIATTEQTYRQHNETVDRQYRTDLITAQREGRIAATQERTAALAEEEAQRKREKAAREARLEAMTGPGGDALNNYDRRVLLSEDPEKWKTREYAASYAKAATPTSEGGVDTYPDMTPFELPRDKDGKPILSYGQPRKQIGPGDLGKYRAIEEQFTTITYTLDTLQKAWQDASAVERAETLAGKPTALRTAWTNAALLAKGDGLFQLGVISGPDKQLLQGVLADPTTFWGAFTSTAEATKQIGMVKDLLGQRRAAAKNAYGGGMAIGGGSGSGAGGKTVLKFDANGNLVP